MSKDGKNRNQVAYGDRETFTNKFKWIKYNMAVEQKFQCLNPSSANKIVQADPDNGQKGS